MLWSHLWNPLHGPRKRAAAEVKARDEFLSDYVAGLLPFVLRLDEWLEAHTSLISPPARFPEFENRAQREGFMMRLQIHAGAEKAKSEIEHVISLARAINDIEGLAKFNIHIEPLEREISELEKGLRPAIEASDAAQSYLSLQQIYSSFLLELTPRRGQS
jgi:hypothetical protein